MDTITAQKLEYILSGYNVRQQDRDAIIDLMDEYAETVASKNFIKPDVIKSVCDRCEGRPESADNVLCADCYSDLHGM